MLNGCAELFLNYPISPVQEVKSRNYKRPFDEVWNCTIEALIKAEENISSIDKNSGLIIVKSDKRKISESEMKQLAIDCPNNVEWENMHSESNIFIKPITTDSAQVTCNSKIIAVGTPYELRNKSGERASFKDIWKGNIEKVALSFPQEYILKSNGTIENNYFVMIAEALLRERDAGI